jgi:TetR/AcrR family transcriptional regulator
LPVPIQKPATKIPSGIGLREQNKIEKRQRIRRAARELFSKHGFDETTLRQIAQRAHVGLGTVFNYVQDKQDLIFLICNEDLARAIDEGAQAVDALPPDQSLVERLVELFRPLYEYYCQDVAISRLALKEFCFVTGGKQAETFFAFTWRLKSVIETSVRKAQRDGEVEIFEDASTVTHLIFHVFSGAVRSWIMGRFPEPNAGLLELRRLLELVAKPTGRRVQSQLVT